jgi:hypothetical protein
VIMRIATTCGRPLVYGAFCFLDAGISMRKFRWFVAALLLPASMAVLPSPAQAAAPNLAVTAATPAEGTYYAVTPDRLLDTRTGNGAPQAPLGPGGVLHLQVAGRGGVPATGVSAVVLNMTVTQPTAASFLTVYPTGVPRPTASNLNFVAGWTGANAVTVALGTDGMVDIYSPSGSTHVIADVVGYYAAPGASFAAGGQYHPFVPERMIDTREEAEGPLPAGYYIPVVVDFGADANSHISAFAVNVTAVDPAGPGFLTTWSGQGSHPGTSTLNFTPHTIVPNMAIVPAAGCTLDPSCYGYPMIAVYNGSGAPTDVLVDIFGIYDDGSLVGGLRFHALTPTRIADTRSAFGAPGALGPATTAAITTPDAIADADTAALALNVTAVSPTASTYLSVWPAGLPGVDRPVVSNLNPTAGQVVPNAVQTRIGPSKQFNVFNLAGSVHVVVDVCGVFKASPAATQTPGATASRTSLDATTIPAAYVKL